MNSNSLNDLIAGIYEVPYAGKYSESLLDKLAGTFGCGFSAVVRQTPDSGRAKVFEHVGFSDRFINDYEQYYAARSVLLRESKRHNRIGEIFCDHMIANYDEYVRSEAYQELFRPNNVAHLMQVHIERRKDWVTAVAFRRSRSAGPFGAAEIRQMSQLVPHLINSARHARYLRDQATVSGSMADILDRLNMPVFLLDKQNRVVFTNESGESLLATGDVLRSQGRKIVAVNSDEQDRFQAMLSEARRAVDGSSSGQRTCMAATGNSGHSPVTLQAMPVTRRAAENGHATRAYVMLLVKKGHKDPPGDRLIRQLYGLTASEAQVVGLLCEGLNVRQIAHRRKTSEAAVRYHLKNIFEKVGVSRQGELIKVVCSGPTAI